jgi:betaine-homocysteine S-methyltransferase
MTRLTDGGTICAEGYLFELERRGYMQAGSFVPEVVLEFPDAVKQLHREFIRSGSDVVEALTYYAHREKLRLIGKEDLLEPMQQQALNLAKETAAETEEAGGERPLVAGNICNTNVWDPADPKSSEATVVPMFEEQIAWAAEAGVDFMIAETLCYRDEAVAALEAINRVGLPSVVTLACHDAFNLRDGVSIVDTVKELEDKGAHVVGVNCTRGPATMLPIALRVREAVSCEVAMLPVPYRTTAKAPVFQFLTDSACSVIPDDRPFPIALDPFTCNRFEVADTAKAALDAGIRYQGVCCGGAPHHVRAIAEVMGKDAPSRRFAPDMTKHYSLGTDSSLKAQNKGFVAGLKQGYLSDWRRNRWRISTEYRERGLRPVGVECRRLRIEQEEARL